MISTGNTIDVLVPGPMSEIRAALSSCAVSGNTFADQLLETIRRAENHEPIGERYAKDLNKFVMQAHAGEWTIKGDAINI